jgi:hypothetical protein
MIYDIYIYIYILYIYIYIWSENSSSKSEAKYGDISRQFQSISIYCSCPRGQTRNCEECDEISCCNFDLTNNTTVLKTANLISNTVY